MKARRYARSAVLAIPLVAAMTMSTPAMADVDLTNVDETVSYAEGEAADWADYATFEATDTADAAAFLATSALGTTEGLSTDPAVVVPLGDATTGEPATNGVFTVDDVKDDNDSGRAEHDVYRYGPVVRTGGRLFFNLGNWQISQGDERLTIRTKVCNYPSNGRGAVRWWIVRNHDGARKELAHHACTNYQNQSEPVWYDSVIVGNGHFVTYGRTYHLMGYWESACTGENSPVSDGRYPPRIATTSLDGTSSQETTTASSTEDGRVECEKMRVFAYLSAH